MIWVIITIVAYLVGGISFSIVLGRWIHNIDVRQYGSGNAGATNVTRIMGITLGATVFLLDAFKGFFMAWVGYKWGGNLGLSLAGMAVVLGHNFPVYYHFQGGKGVSTTIGVMLFTNFCWSLLPLAVAFGIGFSVGFISVGSILYFILMPLVFCLRGAHGSVEIMVMAVVLGILGLVRHRSNIARLLAGEENSFRRKK